MSDESNLARNLADFLSVLLAFRVPLDGISPEYASSDYHDDAALQSCGSCRSQYQLPLADHHSSRCFHLPGCSGIRFVIMWADSNKTFTSTRLVGVEDFKLLDIPLKATRERE
jgi:hypothetical protein